MFELALDCDGFSIGIMPFFTYYYLLTCELIPNVGVGFILHFIQFCAFHQGDVHVPITIQTEYFDRKDCFPYNSLHLGHLGRKLPIFIFLRLGRLKYIVN